MQAGKGKNVCGFLFFPNFATIFTQTPECYDEIDTQGRGPRGGGGDDGKLQPHEADKTHALPRDAAHRRGGRLFRDEGRRSLPLAGRRQFGGDGGMGQGPECRDAGLPVADSVPRRDPRAADPVVELPQGGHPGQTRRCVVLFLQRRAAEPVGALPYDGSRCGGRGVPRSQYALGRRDGGAFVGGFFQGREILRLRGGRIRLGLGGDSCDEHRRPQVHDR